MLNGDSCEMLNVLFFILWELESEIIGFSQESGDLAGPGEL
jgi:hypothetical protein